MKRELKQNEKPSVKQRWFLSALLIAALGTNYYFQVASIQLGELELASRVPADAQPADPKAATQATSSTTQVCTTGECAATLIGKNTPIPKTQAELDAIVKKAAEEAAKETLKQERARVAKEEADKKAEAEKKAKEDAEKKAKEEEAKETPKEKRERLAREKKEKEKEKKEAEQEKRDGEFEEKMSALDDKCGESAECRINGFTSLLGKYSGSKKLSQLVVNKAFNDYVSKSLKDAMKNPESVEQIAGVMEALQTSIPTEYRKIKEKVVDIAKNDAMVRAMEANRNFKMADQLAKAKRFDESNQFMADALRGKDELAASTQIFYNSMVSGLNSSNDFSTLDYVQKNYYTNRQKLLASVANVNGVDLSAAGATVSTSATLSQPSNNDSVSSRTRSSSTTVQNGSTNSGSATLGAPSTVKRLNRGSY